MNGRVQIDESQHPKNDAVDDGDDSSMKTKPSENKGDYIDVPSHPYLMKIMEKQGNKICVD